MINDNLKSRILEFTSNKMVSVKSLPIMAKRYQKICQGIIPNFRLAKLPIKSAKTKKEKQACCVVALQQVKTASWPHTWIGDCARDLDLVVGGVIFALSNKNGRQTNPKGFARYTPFDRITSYDLYQGVMSSSDPALQQIGKRYSAAEFCIMPISWLKVKDLERFLAKQLSTYAGINSSQHKAFLAEIGFTTKNCEEWVTYILQQRSFATIHTFSIVSNSLRVTYEITVPLDKPNSKACRSGRAGSNKVYHQHSFLSYTLVIQYDKDIVTGEYLKVGRPVTGFLHTTPYSQKDVIALLNPHKDAIPWGYDEQNIFKNISALQSQLPLKTPNHSKTNVLPLQQPITNAERTAFTEITKNMLQNKKITRRLLNTVETNIAYENQMQTDYGILSSNIVSLHEQFLTSYFK